MHHYHVEMLMEKGMMTHCAFYPVLCAALVHPTCERTTFPLPAHFHSHCPRPVVPPYCRQHVMLCYAYLVQLSEIASDSLLSFDLDLCENEHHHVKGCHWHHAHDEGVKYWSIHALYYCHLSSHLPPNDRKMTQHLPPA